MKICQTDSLLPFSANTSRNPIQASHGIVFKIRTVFHAKKSGHFRRIVIAVPRHQRLPELMIACQHCNGMILSQIFI
jgi:hypothetical protein